MHTSLSLVSTAWLLACNDVGVTHYDTAPTADIQFPAASYATYAGIPLSLSGVVADAETDDVAKLDVTWQSDLDPQPEVLATADDGTTTALWTPRTAGTYTLTLHVSVDAVSGEDEVSISVLENRPPTVTWSSPAHESVVAEGTLPSLIAMVSDDEAPEVLSLAWTANGVAIADCTGAASAAGTATCDPVNIDAGSTQYCLNATDSVGLTGTACATVSTESCEPNDWYSDSDADGYGDPATSVSSCDAPVGYVSDATDCDDSAAAFHPGADESDCSDPNDYNCDGSVAFADSDGDGYAACEECDDGSAAVNPAATEVCNAIDDDCDGDVDTTAVDVSVWYADVDSDGYGDASDWTAACEAPLSYVPNATDCDDADAAFNPGADESDCSDANDYNCDGSVAFADSDGDGYAACEECDDGSAAVNPAATEVCNGIDDDCDGDADTTAVDVSVWYADVDSDGYGDASDWTAACEAPLSYVPNATDCDDADAAFNPGADESDCSDANDYNCDGSVSFADSDGDGYAACEECDDGSAAVNPAATEVCNGIDDDCDGDVDTTAVDVSVWYADVDSDGYGDASDWLTACDAPASYGSDDTDCDDTDDNVNPSESEVCNNIDDDCDGIVDTDAIDRTIWYVDVDGDSYGSASGTVSTCDLPSGYAATDTDCEDADANYNPGADESDCTDPNDYNCDGSVAYSDADGDGYAACAECDDADKDVNPDAIEVCNGLDDDCDGDADSDATNRAFWFADADGDTYGDTFNSTLVCDAPANYVADDNDCDDSDRNVNPAGTEVCNGIDDDCDTIVDTDATDLATWHIDADGDGYGDLDSDVKLCDQPANYVADSTDCDDAAVDVYPGADETCDGEDDDCDGDVDENASDSLTWYADRDGDGYGDAGRTQTDCEVPPDYVADATDCDDDTTKTNPGADEICDGEDNDCDGKMDEEAIDLETRYADSDGDGYGDDADPTTVCPLAEVPGYVDLGGDCDDSEADVFPGADEICDGEDNDCDGTTDEDALDVLSWYADSDGDGFGDATDRVEACDEPVGFIEDNSDCDDTEGDIFPGADEYCDGLDNDCDDEIDWGLGVPTSYTTISSAITAATAGDTVCVGAGTYVEKVTLSKALILDGYEGSAATFLDGGGVNTVLTANTYAGTAEVRGFTIQNGSGTSSAGVSLSSVKLWLDDVVIADNHCSNATSSCIGTAVYASGGTLDLTDVAIRDNSATAANIHGTLMYVTSGSIVTAERLTAVDNVASCTGQSAPGIFLNGSSFSGTNVIIAGNSATASDGYCWQIAEIVTLSTSTLNLTNATITGNRLDSGADSATGVVHLYSAGDKATFKNVSITDNVLVASNWKGGAVFSWTTPTFVSTYSDYYNNTYTAFYNVTDPTGSNGNIASAPLYADIGAALALDWDLSLGGGSPLIDAGDPALLDPDGSTSDIGAYGGPGASEW